MIVTSHVTKCHAKVFWRLSRTKKEWLSIQTIKRTQRHRAFLTNVREDMLQHANCDQINAASEFVLNLLRVPLSPPTAARLKHHKQILRELAKRRNSLERRKQGAGFRRGLNKAFCNCLR
ncbi:unnamed protein product [Pocillopora meandrina]|uniref:Uncharacterized protein n=1 Tax=Pocillopora meandrina TaxID=46732 RepID=A0AAU9W8R1_9CNID|nr:unnamed protein product [Pocillopora meandrina]